MIVILEYELVPASGPVATASVSVRAPSIIEARREGFLKVMEKHPGAWQQVRIVSERPLKLRKHGGAS